MTLFARNEAANQWLADHPVVLGAGAVVFGLVFLALGVSALVRGRAPAKWGGEVKGGQATVLGVVWLVAAAGCLLFGGYKIVAGLL